jgi:hypothetical protein
VVVTSVSTSIVEALRQPVPIFIHHIPFYEALGVHSIFSAARRFENGDQIPDGLHACFPQLASGSGQNGRPKSLTSLLQLGQIGGARLSVGQMLGTLAR